MSDLPQFYTNTLTAPEINKGFLDQSLHDLQNAALNGVKIIEEGDPSSGKYDGRGIFTGGLGLALTYIRLAQQAPLLAENNLKVPDFASLADARVVKDGPDFPLAIGGLSPLPSKSPIAAVTLRALHSAKTGAAISVSDIACLHNAVNLALSHGPTGHYHGNELGADEVLFGRTGLLWSLLNIRAVHPENKALQPVFEKIADIVRLVVKAGREGSADYVKNNGEKGALPLMWVWMPGHYGIGWAHGLTGIIPVLLSCDPEELSTDSYLQDIAGTVTGLCKLCIEHNGHLPTTIPPRSTSSDRESPLVQICHGSPAILGLLGCAMKSDLLVKEWQPEWDTSARLATDRVWEEGFLSKGGGLCHGIAGNAWPLLLLHDAYEFNADALNEARQNRSTQSSESVISDYFLSKALTMLLHARETKPYNQEPETASNEYRMPDHPYSLYEGLAGTVLAWVDTCAVIKARLRKMEVGDGFEDDDEFKEASKLELGFPCFGGSGATGFL